MLTLQDVCQSRYLLYRGLTDAGFDSGRASLAVDVLLGPELEEYPEPEPDTDTFEPDEDDWADYREWCREVDERLWSDRIERENPGYLSDRDVMVATGCVG